MNTIPNKILRTYKTSTALAAGAIILAVGLIIGVTVARAGGSANSHAGNSADATGGTTLQAGGGSSSGVLNQWNPFQQMRQMQAQMDKMFTQMTRQFQSEPGLSGFTDIPGYSLSLDVRDLKNHYEVHAYLPDAKASNVHVSLKNGQTLKVEVNSQKTEETSNSSKASHSGSVSTNVVTNVSEWGQYEQTVQLPTPVKADQMKIKRHGHELIITIPKK